ncbi:ubiquitin C-terminal hydrolase, family 1 [Plasmodium gonderi]|uniref:ubiquitinyl hydrolase 1 n=1 Tax=Plasmodium gonderi TaxID=77519 RepID=A0A1Y1JEJ4_PLAGO|nr:ubiquitin C-terminal hydrolase, family 1 [Plasmodium gonderi]GAW80939.1 ubiquitin C-terminal hydrolase, family 1 [Plasmodium gonderi]
MQRERSENMSEWCLIESNPCIFNDMLNRMGAKELSVEDVYDLEFFDDYINNKDVVNIENILSIQEYKSEKEKKNNVDENVLNSSGEKVLYNNNICRETKYNKLLKNNSYLYGIIFLFNIGNNYNKNKFIEHVVPENLFFAKQVIPNACATQAILSIVLNKNIELNEEIKNIKSFSANFDSSMKGFTLSNCNFLRNIHNSYKAPVYVERENLNEEKGKSNDSFHFVSYIQYDNNVYMLDGLQEGPVLIGDTTTGFQNGTNEKASWIYIAREHIKKEINDICNSNNNNNGKGERESDNRFNILAVTKDKEFIIQEFINIHRVLRQRVNIKLISLGKNITLTDEINEDYYNSLNIPTIEQLPDSIPELDDIEKKASLEITYLERLLNDQIEIKNAWNKELTFKFFNFYPFIMSSLKLMAKHKLLKEVYQKEKQKKITL